MLKNKYKILTVAAALTAAALTLQSCHRAEVAEQKDDKFQVTDTLLNSLLIDTVKEASALSEITLTGSVAPDENKMAKVFPLVSGIAGSVNVQLGDLVGKGQTLALLRSAEAASFTKDFTSAQADIRSSKRSLESTQDLFTSGLASQKDVELAKADYQKAVAEGTRAGTVSSINKSNGQGYELKSPISGFVVDKNLTSNMQVRTDNNEPLFTIADLSDVYVLVNIYESDISSVQVGDPVKITTLSYPDKIFVGKIDKLYDMLDPENKVMRARVKINNPGNLLKPEMFAEVKIRAKSGVNLPAINTRSIVFDNDKNYVVVVDGKAKVHIQLIDIAKKVEDVAYIRKGLKPGERVIASRQVYMYESLKD